MRIILVIFLSFSMNTFSQQSGKSKIFFHKTSKEVNDKTKGILSNAVLNEGADIRYDKTFICGPQLWNFITKSNIANKITGIRVNFNIPKGTGYVTSQGRAIQKREEFTLIWNLLFKGASMDNFKIRIPNEKELAYYWSIIPYEIEEPIFVVEYSGLNILVDFVGTSLLHMGLFE